MEGGFGIMGRKPTYAMIDGVPMMVKRPMKHGASVYVCIPKEVMDMWELRSKVEYFVLDPQGGTVIVKPCYEKVEVGTL